MINCIYQSLILPHLSGKEVLLQKYHLYIFDIDILLDEDYKKSIENNTNYALLFDKKENWEIVYDLWKIKISYEFINYTFNIKEE